MAIIIKKPKQIEGIRASCQLASKTLDFIEPHVKAGVSTLYLNDLMARFIKDNRARAAPYHYGPPDNPYPRETCISLNDVICHGVPKEDEILKDGDILNIDVTTILNGFYGDTSRMYKVGKIHPDAEKLIQVTKRALDIGISQVWPGNTVNSIGWEIARYAKTFGYGVVDRFCGHGVGLQFHEEPQVNHCPPNRNGIIMEKGMIFTIEPMINIGSKEVLICEDRWTAKTTDGSLSAQFEHTVLVTDTGVEILTSKEKYE